MTETNLIVPDQGMILPPQAPEPAGELAVPAPRRAGGSLAIDPDQTDFTDLQKAALAGIGITADFDPAHVKVFLHFCQSRGLDPWARDVYLVKRKGWNGSPDTYSTQTSINTFRRWAHETGRFRRLVGVYWTNDDDKRWMIDQEAGVRRRLWDDVWLERGHPAAAKVIIEYWDEAGELVRAEAVANWAMFCPMIKGQDGSWRPTVMWAKGGPHMLAKCGEALVLRQTFPASHSGVFIDEEMSRVDQDAAQARRDDFRARREQARKAATQAAPAQPPVVLAPRPHAEPPAQTGADVEVEDGGTPTEVEPDETPGGEPGPDLDTERDMLNGELERQAAIMGTTVAAMTSRWVLAARRNLEDATVDELRALVVQRRAMVAGRLDAVPARDYTALPERGVAAELLPAVPDR